MRLSLLFLLCLFVLGINAQEGKSDINSNKTGDKGITITGFSYPTFLNCEMRSTFEVNYKLSEDFELELQGFYDTYRLANVFKAPLIIKWKLSTKWNLFSGSELFIEQDKIRPRPPVLKVYMVNGMGYDINRNMTLEAKHDLHFNKSNFGGYSVPNLFSLTGRYRF